MKNLSLLFIFSLFLAFFTGQLTTNFDPDRVPEPAEIAEINQVHYILMKSNKFGWIISARG